MAVRNEESCGGNIIKGVVYDTVIRVVNLFLPPNSIKYQLAVFQPPLANFQSK